jgi:uncharacterized repeat protein (TIGR03803 family)
MPSQRSLILLGAALSIAFGLSNGALPVSAASKEQVLFRFNGTDGYRPNGALVFDSSGNLYGTTYEGGAHGAGNVFELTPAADGKWTETELYSFCPTGNCTDGALPSAGVIFDASGKNLYGVTGNGGLYGCGVVFQLTPGADGKWIESVLHSFGNGEDGESYLNGLTFDASGNLYGTTYYGGANSTNCDRVSCGTVFQLKPNSNGKWTEKVVHSFNNDHKDGFWPQAGITLDASGNLYGTTGAGGAYSCPGGFGCGTVFRLSLSATGKWTETILYSFDGSNGDSPDSNVVFDAQGNLYGATFGGGSGVCNPPGCGAIFELTPGANGGWTEKILHSFYRDRQPWGVILDAAGNLYGATWVGGRYSYECPLCGTAFELSRGENGKWTETTLHSFGKGKDGGYPIGTLNFDGAGNLYGATYEGGINGKNCLAGGCGTVFRITP